MKLNKHEQGKPNIAGLTSRLQRAEMKLILAGTWPPLKPLPVFKYETDEYRATIHFDKTRGEWVCRKTSFPSNKVQELRGGLTEITMALPHGQEEVLAETVAAEPQEQELEKDANRRFQAILEWRENYENGALYSKLQDYLSESQQDEIYDSVRLSLTARQLQFNPMNVAFVFDSLLNAGGRLATLMEIAQRNKAEQEADAQAQAKAAALEARHQVPVEAIHPARDRRLQTRTAPASRVYVELGDTNSGIVLNIGETGMAVAAAGLLEVGDYLPRIRFQWPSSSQSIEISAQIVWQAESRKAAGIRFVDLTADARNQISNWIASEKPAPESAQLPKPLRHDKQPLEISSLKSRRLFGNPSVRDEEAAARYSEMLPSESINAKHTGPFDAIKPQHCSLPIPVGSHAHAGDSEVGSVAEISTGDLPQSLEASCESSADRIEDSPSHFYVFEISGFQVAALVFLFAVISLTVGLTVGRGPLGKRLRDAQKSILAVDAPSPALSNRPGETTSRTSTPPAANTINTPTVNPPAPETEESPPESPSAQSLNARPADSGASVGPAAPFSAVTSQSLIDSDNSSGANKLDDGTPFEKPSVNPEARPERNGSTGLIARNAPPRASPKPAHSTKAVSRMRGPLRNPAPRRATPAWRAAPHQSSPSAILVTGPGDGSKPFRLILAEKPIAASSSFAVTSQLSVLVAPEPGPAVTHKPARLQAGELVSFVWPRYPMPGDRYGSSETVKVRTTVGELGQVLDVQRVSGSTSLFPAAVSAIRRWRYKPTLLNGRPVHSQLDITIEFRPSK